MGETPMPPRLAGADVERFYRFATGDLAHAMDNFLAVEKDLVAHNRMRGEDDEPVAFDAGGMRVGGVGGADDLGPTVANVLFGRGAADLMLLHQLLDDRGERLGGATAGARRLVGRNAA